MDLAALPTGAVVLLAMGILSLTIENIPITIKGRIVTDGSGHGPGGGLPPLPQALEKYGVEVRIGTYPIPQKYLTSHMRLGTWNSEQWQTLIAPILSDEKTRIAYD